MEEWYLIGDKTKPNVISGYENDAFVQYKDDAFDEALDTEIATTVLLFNQDLSESVEIRAIIQGNNIKTMLSSMGRTILTNFGTLHSGWYIYFENQYWIIDSRIAKTQIYEKATMKVCQYKLKWLNPENKVIERWANLSSASKYDVGEDGNSMITTSTNDLTVIIPNDLDSYSIEEKRVFIDSNPISKEKVFKITRNDDVLFNHGSNNGILSLIAHKVAIDDSVDDRILGLCNCKKSIVSETEEVNNEDLNLKITYSSTPSIRLGSNYKTFKVTYDSIGDWNIICDFVDKLDTKITGNSVKIRTSDNASNNLIGKQFELRFTIGNSYVSEMITIESNM